MLAATIFFRSERMSCRISWMLASLTCSSVMFMPPAADGADCWPLSNVAAAIRDAARRNEKVMLLFKLESSCYPVVNHWRFRVDSCQFWQHQHKFIFGG